MKTSIITSLLIIIIALTSCTKTMDVVPPTPSETVMPAKISLHEVNASEDFNWSTTKQIKFSFNGGDAQGYSLLLRVTDTEGNVIMQKMQKSDQTFQTDLKVPSSFTTLTVSYGADTKTIDCAAGSATLNY